MGNFSETGCNEQLSLSGLSTIWSKLDRVVNNVYDNHENTRYWRGDGGWATFHGVRDISGCRTRLRARCQIGNSDVDRAGSVLFVTKTLFVSSPTPFFLCTLSNMQMPLYVSLQHCCCMICKHKNRVRRRIEADRVSV